MTAAKAGRSLFWLWKEKGQFGKKRKSLKNAQE
jgi:hypothetical protein